MRGACVLACSATAAMLVLAFAAGGSAAIQGSRSTGLQSYIVVLKPGADQAPAIAKAKNLGGVVSMRYHHALNGFAARLSTSASAALERNPNVSFVEPDLMFQAAATCDAQCLPAGIDRIDADRGSVRAGDGRGSVVGNTAVLDTGIDASHPDLNVVGGVNCTNDKYGASADPNGHGTHVAGTIGARDNALGVVGVAPGIRLWSVRVLNKNGSGTASGVLCGIDWVAGTRTDSDPGNDITVANMSLGAKGSDDGSCGAVNKDAFHAAICRATAAGITFVAAAGNSGNDLQGSTPAAYDEVLAVTAVADFDGMPGGLASPNCTTSQTDDAAGSFSDFATLAADRAHTVAAPGVCVLSTASPGSTLFSGTDLYGRLTGTSMASPHAAGTVALCIASGACAGLTPGQIIAKIVADAAAYSGKNPGYGFSGDPLHGDGGKYYGYLINAGLY